MNRPLPIGRSGFTSQPTKKHGLPLSLLIKAGKVLSIYLFSIPTSIAIAVLALVSN